MVPCEEVSVLRGQDREHVLQTDWNPPRNFIASVVTESSGATHPTGNVRIHCADTTPNHVDPLFRQVPQTCPLQFIKDDDGVKPEMVRGHPSSCITTFARLVQHLVQDILQLLTIDSGSAIINLMYVRCSWRDDKAAGFDQALVC